MARFYEQVEYRRILSELGLQIGSSTVRGAWSWTLFHMWAEEKCEFTMSVESWAKFWNEPESTAQNIIEYLARHNVCSVTRNALSQNVTLTNRYLARKAKVKEQNRLRQERFRRNAEVTPKSNIHSKSNSNKEKRESPLASLNLHPSTKPFCDFWTELTGGNPFSPKQMKCINKAFKSGNLPLEFAKAEAKTAPKDIAPFHLADRLIDAWRYTCNNSEREAAKYRPSSSPELNTIINGIGHKKDVHDAGKGIE